MPSSRPVRPWSTRQSATAAPRRRSTRTKWRRQASGRSWLSTYRGSSAGARTRASNLRATNSYAPAARLADISRPKHPRPCARARSLGPECPATDGCSRSQWQQRRPAIYPSTGGDMGSGLTAAVITSPQSAIEGAENRCRFRFARRASSLPVCYRYRCIWCLAFRPPRRGPGPAS